MRNDDTKMPEPMSKEEMIDTLKGLVFGTFDRTTAKEREALDLAIKELEQARPIGKWKKISPAKIYECTNCYQMIMTDDIDCYNYCHQCGADMR